MRHKRDVVEDTILSRGFAYLLILMAVIVLVVGTLARTEGESKLPSSHVSMRTYNTIQQQKTADACRHFSCASGSQCVLTERGVTCLP